MPPQTRKARSTAADFFSTNDGSGSEEEAYASDDSINVKKGLKEPTIDSRFAAFSDEEDDDNVLDSDEDEENDASKGKSGSLKQSTKRGHLDVFGDDEDDEESDDDIDEALIKDSEQKDFTAPDELEEAADGDNKSKKRKSKKLKSLSADEVEKANQKIKKSGLIYISKIPPYMKPIKLRQILARFGEVNRIFLVPEDPKVYQRRVKYGGNKKKNFTEGWAEFVKKSHAKLAAETLNGNIIGGKKGNYYHDDILNIKYLHKFKWNNLTEQIAYEKQVRQSKLRAEIAQATRENKAFVKNVERSKMIEGIQAKRREKKGESATAEEDTKVRRAFDQRVVKTTRTDTSKPSVVSDERVSNVLSKVF